MVQLWPPLVIGLEHPQLRFPYLGDLSAATEFLLSGRRDPSFSNHPTVLASQVAWITGESQFSRLKSIYYRLPDNMPSQWIFFLSLNLSLFMFCLRYCNKDPLNIIAAAVSELMVSYISVYGDERFRKLKFNDADSWMTARYTPIHKITTATWVTLACDVVHGSLVQHQTLGFKSGISHNDSDALQDHCVIM